MKYLEYYLEIIFQFIVHYFFNINKFIIPFLNKEKVQVGFWCKGRD